MRLIFTVDLIAPVLHPAVPHVVADQLAGDAIRGVAALELRRVVAAGYVLHTPDTNAVAPDVLYTVLPLSQSKLP